MDRFDVEAGTAKRFRSVFAGLRVTRSEEDGMSKRGELRSDRKTDAAIGACHKHRSFCGNIHSAYSLNLQEGFDGAAFVHGAIAFRDLVERQREVEDFAGVDRSIQDQVDQFWQKPPD